MENKTTNRAKMSNCSTYSAVIKLVKSDITSRLFCFLFTLAVFLAGLLNTLQIFCPNNKIHLSLADDNNSTSFKRKMVWKGWFLLIHKQQTNLWMKQSMILAGLVGKIVKYHPLSERIRLQDLEDSARSQAWKKIKVISSNSFRICCVIL